MEEGVEGIGGGIVEGVGGIGEGIVEGIGGRIVEDVDEILQHFFGVDDTALPEIICASGFELFAPVIDPSVLIGLEPCVLLVHLGEFSECVTVSPDPYIGVMEIADSLLDGQRDGCFPFIVVERIACACVLEQVREVVLAAGDIPCATKIIARHNRPPFGLLDRFAVRPLRCKTNILLLHFVEDRVGLMEASGESTEDTDPFGACEW